jgi:DNA-binding NtrC family response regulator
LAAGAELTLAGRTMGEIEEMALRQALAACGQSRARAARMLGISEKTVYNMLRRFETTAAPEATRLAG